MLGYGQRDRCYGTDVDPNAFTVGTRVCANFFVPGYVFGDLGAHTDGVLVEYKVFEADVSFHHVSSVHLLMSRFG